LNQVRGVLFFYAQVYNLFHGNSLRYY
jgi:hypothetical protein